MTDKKFFKTVVIVEVLSEDSPIPDGMELADIHEAITTGNCCGKITFNEPQILTGKEAADALTEYGSDPGFFQLDDEGTDLGGNEDNLEFNSEE